MIRFLAVVVALCSVFPSQGGEAAKRPNIVFILADDLGYGDLSCYGQKKFKTPNIDRLAGRGLRFTQFYAGSTVCAPSRCVLMTAKHTGHATIRGNVAMPLEPNETTVSRLLKSLGYVTGLVGKWGLGAAGTVGAPNRQGFDTFFGYLNQVHAHNSYPDFLWRNETKTPIPGNIVTGGVASTKGVHSQDLFIKEALEFVEKNKANPFFLYWAVTIPHANNERGAKEENGLEAPDDKPYAKENWPATAKTYAALIAALDRDVGRLLAKLRELGIEENTLVIFSSDNGPHREGGNDPDFFNSSGGLRGIKRSLHEGGLRVPFIAAWPGKIAPAVSDYIGGFQDFLPTAVELAGGKVPARIDGISLAPTFLGRKDQKVHEFLYWEFFEKGYQQAARAGKWKAVRPALGAKLELYDLEKDLAETTDIAASHPDVVARIETYLQNGRVDSPHFPLKGKEKK